MFPVTASLCSTLLFVGVFVFVSADKNTITAEPGQNVTLPCRAPNNNILAVEWSRADLAVEYVLLYRDDRFDQDNQHPSFKNRVDLQDRQMKDGDVSLILKNVTINDTGTYECRVVQSGPKRRKRAVLDVDPISIIYLHVDPPGQTGGHTEDGGKEDASDGLWIIGLLVVAVVFSVAFVPFWIYRERIQCNQDSHHPPAESQIEFSENYLNSETPAAEYNDRNGLEAINFHQCSTRIPDVRMNYFILRKQQNCFQRHQSAVDNV